MLGERSETGWRIESNSGSDMHLELDYMLGERSETREEN